MKIPKITPTKVAVAALAGAAGTVGYVWWATARDDEPPEVVDQLARAVCFGSLIGAPAAALAFWRSDSLLSRLGTGTVFAGNAVYAWTVLEALLYPND